MHRIVYSSQLTRKMSAGEIERLVEVSRRNNLRDDVTGYLLHNELHCFQVLEGPEDVLMERYGKIARDSRHGDLRLVRSEPIAAREFVNCPMGVLTSEHLPTWC
ncbi:BLUF domain-containing protein [Phycobacter azelaicus]|uniref:BLUF domain-containing protein n=1 Tax=Phycobacter azelaicus TaxID=2668075 RepID=UPI001A0A5F40|nr:BLUF domain-containing protein [Phycobacter azelaicus]MBE1297398.1 hypothetical protein [Paracoccaceae bacterium]